MASSYDISGTGLARAKMTGSFAIVFTISFDSTLPFDSPTKTSAPLTASSSVWISVRLVAKNFFCSFRSSRLVEMTPFESSITIFSFWAPMAIYSLVHEMAAAPAPLTTIFTFLMSLPMTSRAFFSPAAEMMAVPCWSSCITGISSVRFRRSSM